MSWHQVLGVARNADERTVKRAYAALIKQYRPDSHPTEFARVREAYEAAMEEMRRRARAVQAREAEQAAEAQAVDQADPADLAEMQSDGVENAALEAEASISLPLAMPKSRVNGAGEAQPLRMQSDDASPLSEGPQAQPAAMPEYTEPARSELLPPAHERLPHELHGPQELVPDVADFTRARDEAADSEDELSAVDQPVRRAAAPGAQPQPSNPAVWIEEIAQQREQGEDAAVIALRERFKALEGAGVDDRAQFEDELLNWLLYSGEPGLLVYLEAAAHFEWELNLSSIRARFGEWSERQLYALRTLARLYFFARYSPNRWERALFPEPGQAPRLPRVGAQIHVNGGRQLAEIWGETCEEAGAPMLRELADQRVTRHFLQGWIWTSTDLLFALIATWIAWGMLSDLVPQRGVWLVVLPAVFGLAASGQPLVRYLFRRFPRLAQTWEKLRGWNKSINLGWTIVALIGLYVLFMLVMAVFGSDGMRYLFMAFFWAICVGAVIFVAWLIWCLTAGLDYLALAWVWRWRGRVRRHLLEEYMARGDVLHPRLGWRASLGAVGGTLKGWRKGRERRGKAGPSWTRFTIIMLVLMIVARFLHYVVK